MDTFPLPEAMSRFLLKYASLVIVGALLCDQRSGNPHDLHLDAVVALVLLGVLQVEELCRALEMVDIEMTEHHDIKIGLDKGLLISPTVRELLKCEQKSEAIRIFRRETGLNHKDASDLLRDLDAAAAS